MDQQELKRQQQQMLEERNRLFQEQPELANWVKTKKILRWVVIGFLLVHEVISLILMVQLNSGGFIKEIVKCLFQLFWLWVFMSPWGNWRLNLILYLSAAVNLMQFINGYGDLSLFKEIFSVYPLMGILICIEAVFPFLLLAFAIFLTAVPSHRELSDRIQAVQREAAEAIR